MLKEDFDKFVEKQQKQEFKILCERGDVYGGVDRFRNFKNAARIAGTTPQLVLYGMFLKHFEAWMSFMEKPTTETSWDQWQEKIGDMRNYLLLCLGIVDEEFKMSTGKWVK